MNPNRITLLQLAEQKLHSNLQLPAADISKIRILDLPVLHIENGIAKVFGQSDDTGVLEYQSSDWTGLTVSAVDGVVRTWLLSKDEDTGETEFLCLGSPQSVSEALNKALDAIHHNMIHCQGQALRDTA